MDKLEPYEQLLIRACKRSRGNSMRQLRKICQKGYWNTFKDDESEDQLVLICLERIWRKYVKHDGEDIAHILQDIHPNRPMGHNRPLDGMPTRTYKTWMGEREIPKETHHAFIVYFFWRITFTEGKKFPDYHAPAWFRNRDK